MHSSIKKAKNNIHIDFNKNTLDLSRIKKIAQISAVFALCFIDHVSQDISLIDVLVPLLYTWQTHHPWLLSCNKNIPIITT